MNGSFLSEAEKQEIDTRLCYALKTAKIEIAHKFTEIIQTESEDQRQQLELAKEFSKNSLQFLKELMELNIQTNNAYSSSVILDLVFKNSEDLEVFMGKFREGKITEITQNTLITSDVLSLLNLRTLQLSVEVSEEDFRKYLRTFQRKVIN